MSNQEIVDTLRGVRFLHDIRDEYLRQIAAIAEFREVPADGVVFTEGRSHPYIYLVARGAVALEIRVSDRTVTRMETLGDGELLGWSPVLGQILMTATARALQPSRLIAIDANQLMALCEHSPRFGFEFMKRTAQALAQRLAALRLQLSDVYRHELPTVSPFPLSEEI